MSDWIVNKDLGAWDFTLQAQKPRYNEGSSISTYADPVWKVSQGQPAVTEEHLPCGYWTKDYTVAKKVIFEDPIEVAIGGSHVAWSPATETLPYGRFISVYVFSGNRQVSDDGGVTWTSIPNSNSRAFRWVSYHGGIWFMSYGYLSATPFYQISTDNGDTWTEYEHVAAIPLYVVSIQIIEWCATYSCFIMTVNDAETASNYLSIYSSTDGVNWTFRFRGGRGQFFGRVVDVNGSAYLHSYNTDSMLVSSGDLDTWTSTPAEISSSVKTCSDNTKMFIAEYTFNSSSYDPIYLDGELTPYSFVNFNYSSILGYIGVVNFNTAKSTDGHNWTLLDNTYSGYSGGYICFGADRYVRVNSDRHIMALARIV